MFTWNARNLLILRTNSSLLIRNIVSVHAEKMWRKLPGQSRCQILRRAPHCSRPVQKSKMHSFRSYFWNESGTLSSIFVQIFSIKFIVFVYLYFGESLNTKGSVVFRCISMWIASKLFTLSEKSSLLTRNIVSVDVAKAWRNLSARSKCQILRRAPHCLRLIQKSKMRIIFGVNLVIGICKGS